MYAQILSVWSFFWFISSPMSTLFNVLEKQEFGLRLNLANLATRLISLLVGGFLNNARLGLLLFGISGVVVYGYLAFSIMGEAGVPWSATGKILLSNILIALPAGALIVALQFFGVSSVIVLAVSGILLVAYMTYRVMTDSQLRIGLLALMKTRN